METFWGLNIQATVQSVSASEHSCTSARAHIDRHVSCACTVSQINVENAWSMLGGAKGERDSSVGSVACHASSFSIQIDADASCGALRLTLFEGALDADASSGALHLALVRARFELEGQVKYFLSSTISLDIHTAYCVVLSKRCADTCATMSCAQLLYRYCRTLKHLSLRVWVLTHMCV